ncbi:Uncharacterised protein [Mycobacteroides abscessus subsp. abscessus]|nr:Uncharacterised protein [Mycobacteroides abscessus subsp. abscessus]
MLHVEGRGTRRTSGPMVANGCFGKDADAPGQERQRPAGVCELKPDTGVAAQGSARQHQSCRPSGIESELLEEIR